MILGEHTNFYACLKESARDCMCFPGMDRVTFPTPVVVVALLKVGRFPSAKRGEGEREEDRQS